MGDWIKLHRLLLDWEWFTTPGMLRFWVYCLLRASHKSHTYKGIPLDDGQFIDGRKAMAFRTGLSEQQIRTCIERLKSTNELTSKSTSEYTVFTINSWKKYQIGEECNQQINQPSTSHQPAINHIQEGNKDKNVKKNTNTVVSVPETLLSISGFYESWEQWLIHLKEKRKYPSATVQTAQLKKLGRMDDPVGAICHSIESNYQGIFEGFKSNHRGEQAKPDFMQEIKRVDGLMRKKYGIETTGEDHPRATEPMLCAPAFSTESGDFECGDSDNWERMH